MKRVVANENWSLFCPNEAKGLYNVWGTEFEELYAKYEAEGKARRVVKAQDLWYAILEAQIETGTPYLLFKDACNRKSNQQNLGTIKCSNLCTEVIEYSAPDEVAVCNLASLSLPKFVNETDHIFYHDKLFEVVKHVTYNLNAIIDGNYYPVEEARRSNLRHRPVGIGIQGLADAFLKMRYPFESPEAKKLNREIFETIYFAALTASNELAERDGCYETFKGSPASKGILQFDMWDGQTQHSGRWDWDGLVKRIRETGLRNSLLVAPMPTASTSQILGNNECFEPYTSNIYNRRVLAGEFTVLNKYLLRDLEQLGLWTPEMKQKIIANKGSVQKIDEIPTEIKALYKVAWEIKGRGLIDMAADRGRYIDQSQSFSYFVAQPNVKNLSTMHMHGWKQGLKTGMYYLRRLPVADAIQFTVTPSAVTAAARIDAAVSPKEKLVAAGVDMPPVSAAEIMSTTSPKHRAPLTFAEEVVGDICRMEEGCLVCGS